jgi:hypothetical protein
MAQVESSGTLVLIITKEAVLFYLMSRTGRENSLYALAQSKLFNIAQFGAATSLG